MRPSVGANEGVNETEGVVAVNANMVVDENKRVNANQAYTNERVHTQLSVDGNEVVSAIEMDTIECRFELGRWCDRDCQCCQHGHGCRHAQSRPIDVNQAVGAMQTGVSMQMTALI